MGKRKRLLSLVLAVAMLVGCLPGYVAKASGEEKTTKVVVSVEGQTLGQGFYIEPTIVTFDEFIDYWAAKGEIITPESITAGGVLSYALQQNGTPMEGAEYSSGPGYLSTIKGIDKGYTELPQFLKDAGIVLEEYDGDKDLSERKYTPGAGWMYTEGNWMSDQSMASHKFYTYGSPYSQNGETYYVVRLQYSVAGLGADLGFRFDGGASYGYEAADKGQLYILYAKLNESGFFSAYPEVKEQALRVMNTLNATQSEVDAAYESLLGASLAEKPVFITDLSEESVHYGVNETADILTVEASVSRGSLTYEWVSSADQVNWTSLEEDGTSYRPSTEQPGTVYYKCIATNYDAATGLSNFAESKIATVVTGAETPIFSVDLDENEIDYLTIDTAEKLRVDAQISGEGKVTYQWYESDNKESWSVIVGETSQEYQPKTERVGKKYYKCTATNTYGESRSSVDSKIAAVTVRVDSPTLTTNLRTTTYNPKFDEEFSLHVEASVRDGGVLSYQWYAGENLATNGSVGTMTPIEGATSNSYKVDTSKAGALYYKVVVTNTLQGNTVSSVSNWSRVELNAERPRFTQNLDREERYYLVGEENPEPLEVEAVVSDGGQISYQWYESGERPWGVSYMTPIEGETRKTFTPDTSKGHTTYYACRVTNTNRGTAESADSEIVMVSVSCEKPVITRNLEDTVQYNAGDTPKPLKIEVAKISDGGTLTYQWYQTEQTWISSFDQMEAIDGATKSTYTPDLSKNGVTYACRVTNTKDGYTSYTDSNMVKVIITCEAPAIEKDLDTEKISYNQDAEAEPLTVKASVKDGGDLTYQWYNSNGIIEGATDASYVPSTDIVGTTEYWVTVTNTKLGITNSTDSRHAVITVMAKKEYISNEEELRAMQPSGNYTLTADIQLTKDWEPINNFAGILDGNGHTISNLVINSAQNGQLGFFNTAGNGAVIKNLGLIGTVTATGMANVGALVGATSGADLTISNCYVNAAVNGHQYYNVGGLIGNAMHSAAIENCYFIGTLTGGDWDYSYSGGLVGQFPWNGSVKICNSYTTCDKAVGTYNNNTNDIKNVYCGSDANAPAVKIPESMDEFLETLNGGQEIFISDENNINGGYPVLSWQKAEEPEVPETEEKYWGEKTEAKVYDDFQNDIWLQYQQKEMQVGDSVNLRPWRVEQIVSNTIANDVARPVFHFEIISGNSVSLDTDSSAEKVIVTAQRPGTSVVKVTYDALEYKDKTWGAISPVNTGYAVFTVGEKGTAVIECSEELQNWRHYDTIYYNEGETVPYTFKVSAKGAKSLKVTLNGEEIQGKDGEYTANLENRSNIIGIQAKDAAGKLKSFYRVIDARFIEVNVENKSNPGKAIQAGDTANISFRGITMPVYKLATIYNPCMNGWGSESAHVIYENEILGTFKGKCRQWDLATNNSFDVTFEKAGAYDFYSSNGIYCEWWGQKLGFDITAEESGEPNLNAPVLKDYFSKLPPFTVEVIEETKKISVEEALKLAEEYLKNHVTNPIVNTIGGEWSVIAMARYGILDENTKTRYLSNLYQTLDEKDGVLDKRAYTEYSRVILALTSMGIDPSDVNGYHLLLPLAEFEKVQWQGINGPIWALIALDSYDYEIPKLTKEDVKLTQTTREKLIHDILSKQLDDGGWALAGNTSDADMTAMAIHALAPYYEQDTKVKDAIDEALNTLSKMQTANGGFSSYDGENLESAAQTVMALSALDVSLLSDERFVKNGNSVLDYLLTYQLSDGSFKHTPGGNEAEAMSSDQGTLALLAYYRATTGQNALFDMSDVQINIGEEEESAKNVEAFREKMNTLPKIIRIKHRAMVYAMLTELDGMGKFEEKETFRAELQMKLEAVDRQIKAVEQLDEDIWQKINPLSVTKKDAEVVQSLMKRYENIPDENKEYVKYRKDLLKANAIIEKLLAEKPAIDKPVIETPATERPAEKPQQVTLNTKQSVDKTQKTSGTATANTDEAQSNIVEAQVKDNIVAKSELDKVKDTDKNLRMTGKTPDGAEYTFTLNGKDVKEVMDIHIGLSYTSQYESEIRQLAGNPFILEFVQNGSFPGPMLVEISVDRADGEYLLLYYNADEQKAEYVQKIEVKDNKTKFLVEKGGTYFIDTKASTKSLKEKEEETAAEEEKETLQDTENVQRREDVQKTNTVPYIALGVVVAAILLVLGYVVLKKRKSKEE